MLCCFPGWFKSLLCCASQSQVRWCFQSRGSCMWLSSWCPAPSCWASWPPCWCAEAEVVNIWLQHWGLKRHVQAISRETGLVSHLQDQSSWPGTISFSQFKLKEEQTLNDSDIHDERLLLLCQTFTWLHLSHVRDVSFFFPHLENTSSPLHPKIRYAPVSCFCRFLAFSVNSDTSMKGPRFDPGFQHHVKNCCTVMVVEVAQRSYDVGCMYQQGCSINTSTILAFL